MTPKIERSEPVFVQIATNIRNRILAGELREGDLVPSSRKLAEEWGVAIATATKVLGALQAEGLVRAVVGKGTVVAADASNGPQARLSSIRRTGRIYREGEVAEIKSAELADAPVAVADALGLEIDATVLRRHRLTRRDGVPTSSSVSWFDGALAKAAPKLLEAARLIQGTPRYIEEMTGRTIVRGRDLLSAGAATEQEAEALDCVLGTPVLRGQNWFYDNDGKVIEYGESTAVPGRWSAYEYELR